MKCVMCEYKKPLKPKYQSKKYNECGLNYITLKKVKVYQCPNCSEEYYGYGDLDKLHTTIARVLINKKGQLDGREICFLRKYLGYSSAMIAKLTDYAVETISRYENEKTPISQTYDILLRALVAIKIPKLDRDYDIQDRWLNNQGETYKRLEFRPTKDGCDVRLAA